MYAIFPTSGQAMILGAGFSFMLYILLRMLITNPVDVAYELVLLYMNVCEHVDNVIWFSISFIALLFLIVKTSRLPLPAVGNFVNVNPI